MRKIDGFYRPLLDKVLVRPKPWPSLVRGWHWRWASSAIWALARVSCPPWTRATSWCRCEIPFHFA